MAARRNRNRQRRRRGRFGGLYKLLSCLVIFAAILIGCVAFFRVNQVTVTGNRRYSAEEIVSASGVKTGDNLFLINKPQAAGSIQRKLPYVRDVSVVRLPPDTLELRIVECSAVAAVRSGDSWWLIDERGKLLETGDESLGAGYPQVLGLTPVTPTLGGWLTVEEGQGKLSGLTGLLTALSDRGMMGNVTGFIDLTSSGTIYFGFGDELTVAMPMNGDFDNLAFRVQRTMETLQNQGETVTGTLDLTYGDNTAHILTDRWLPEE